MKLDITTSDMNTFCHESIPYISARQIRTILAAKADIDPRKLQIIHSMLSEAHDDTITIVQLAAILRKANLTCQHFMVKLAI